MDLLFVTTFPPFFGFYALKTDPDLEGFLYSL